MPTSVQLVPSSDSKPVSVSPERVSRSHSGESAETRRAAGCVVHVVVLHPHAVVGGDHDRRVRRSRCGVLLDDDAGLRPLLKATLYAVGRIVTEAWDQAGQRGDAHRDAAVARQWLVHEGEGVGHGLAVRSRRRAAVRVPAAGTVAPRSGQQPEQYGHHGGEHQADDPAADRPELRPLGVEQVDEPSRRGSATSTRTAWSCWSRHRSLRCPGARRGAELDRISGELHVGLLQRRPVC